VPQLSTSDHLMNKVLPTRGLHEGMHTPSAAIRLQWQSMTAVEVWGIGASVPILLLC